MKFDSDPSSVIADDTEYEQTPCRECRKQKYTDLMTECSACGRLVCTSCKSDIKNKRANMWWWMGSPSAALLSRSSAFRCSRCIKSSDSRGNIFVLILGALIIIGALVAAEMNGIGIFNF
tara:strand:- start:66 stop:425 length:360 start_codon:yes stop_codon:yes gene_type:complete